MTKKLFSLFLILFSVNAFSQINFEEGYFIKDDTKKKVECYILNKEWYNTPKTLKYKTSENGEVLEISTEKIKEFGISGLKYETHTVNIDLSSNKLSELTSSRGFNYSQEKILLKELVKGKVNLYEYKTKNLSHKFFYSSREDKNIKPLGFKKYIISTGKVGNNEEYKQILINLLKSEKILKNQITRLNYNQASLTKIFEKYNRYEDNLSVNPKKEKGKNKIRVKLNAGLLFPLASSSTFGFQPRFEVEEFETSPNFMMNIEVENILKFNRNKWSLFGGIGYEKFNIKGEFGNGSFDIYNGLIGMRHYLYLNNRSKLFVNAKANLNLPRNTEITYVGKDFRRITENVTIDIEPLRRTFGQDVVFPININYTFGVGYDNDLIQVNFNYSTPRNLFEEFIPYNIKYGSYSISVGFDITNLLRKQKI